MLRNKKVNVVISLLIAIVLWSYVIIVENPPVTQKTEGIPIRLYNVETLEQSGYAILSVSNETVTVSVSGDRASVNALDKDQIKVTADVMGYTEGEHQVPLEISGPNSVSIAGASPAKVTIVVEPLVSVYKPVDIRYSGKFPEGTEPGDIEIQPEQIEVKGAKSLVESVAHVWVTVPASQITKEGVSLPLEVAALNAQGDPVQGVKLSATTVNVNASLYNLKKVPLSVEITGQVDERYEMTGIDVPKTVTLRGKKDALEGITALTGSAIDISEITVTSELPVTLNLPEGVELAQESSEIFVKIDIKGISKKEFEFYPTDIIIEGLAEGMTAYVNTPVVHLKAVGKEAILNTVEKADFLLSVDVTDLPEGLSTSSVKVSYEKEMNGIEIDPQEVQITINEAT